MQRASGDTIPNKESNFMSDSETQSETDSKTETNAEVEAGDEHEDEQIVTKGPITQPEPDSRLRKIAQSTPLHNSAVGSGEYTGTQAEIGVTKAYRDEYAVQRDDGALLAAIRVTPAPMATKDNEAWRKTVDSLARILAAEVDYHCQWFNPMKSVDYESRRQQYETRAQELHNLGSLHRRDAYHILADICSERAETVGVLQESTMSREYYIVVAAEAEEAVVSLDDDAGLASVPILGSIITQRRLSDQSESEEHVQDLLNTLDTRVHDLARSIRTLEGIQTHPIPSSEFSRVLADYYRGEDVYSYQDFTSLIREAPVPSVDDPSDAEYGGSFDHVSAYDKTGTGRQSQRQQSQPRATADGGAALPDDIPAHLNSGATANIATDEEEFERHYKTRLSPDELDKRAADELVIDRDWHSMTLCIRDWPDRPPLGMLEDVLNFDEPGVRVTTSTHIEGLDINSERRRLKSTEQSLRMKAEDAEESDSPFADRRRREHEAVQDVKEAIEEADAGLFATNTYIELRAPTKDLVEDSARQLKSRLKELNATLKPMSHNHDTGYRTVAPVVDDTGYESVKMTGDGLAALIPWTSHNLIEPGGVEVGTHGDRCEPTILDLMNRDTGYNLGLFGNIGSGKSTTLKQLLLRLKLTNEEYTLVMTDPLQEFAGMCEAFRGDRIVIGGDTSINPLRIEPTPEDKLSEIGSETPFKDANRRFISFIETYYGLENLDLGKKRGVWQIAAKRAYRTAGITRDPDTHGNESPTLADVLDVLYDIVNNPDDYVNAAIDEDEDAVSDLKERAIAIVNSDIGPFAEGGAYHHLTGPTNIDISDSDVVYLDLQRYEGEQKTGLMMQLLVSQIYEQAKVSSEPTIMAMDESHYMLKNSSDLAFLKQAVRHSRHHDLSLMFSTQTVSEFFHSTEGGEDELTENAKVIIDHMSVKIYHYLQEMDEDWADELGLSKNEMEYIQDADPGNESRGYSEALLSVNKEGSYPIRVEMHDSLNPKEFALIEYDPSDYDGSLTEYLQERIEGTEDRASPETEWSWT